MSYQKKDIDKSVAEKMLGDVFGEEPKPAKPAYSWQGGSSGYNHSNWKTGGYGSGYGSQASMLDDFDSDDLSGADAKFGVSKARNNLFSAWSNSTLKKAVKGNTGMATQFCIDVMNEMADEVEQRYGRQARERFLTQMLKRVEDIAWNG